MIARDTDLVLTEASKETGCVMPADLIERIRREGIDVAEGNDRIPVVIVSLDGQLDAPAVVVGGAVAVRDRQHDGPFPTVRPDVSEHAFGRASCRDVCVEVEKHETQEEETRTDRSFACRAIFRNASVYWTMSSCAGRVNEGSAMVS